MYNKTKLRPLGKSKVKVRNPRNHKLYRLEFQVVALDDRIPLLGRKASGAMRLIKVQYENILTVELCPAMKGTSCDGHMTMGKTKTEFQDIRG